MTQPQAIRQDVFQDIVQDIRRRRDGSIDIDFYRADAIALRNRAIRDTFRLMALAKVRMPFKQWRMRLVLLANGPLTRWFRQAPRPDVMKATRLSPESTEREKGSTRIRCSVVRASARRNRLTTAFEPGTGAT